MVETLLVEDGIVLSTHHYDVDIFWVNMYYVLCNMYILFWASTHEKALGPTKTIQTAHNNLLVPHIILNPHPHSPLLDEDHYLPWGAALC